MKSYLIKDIPEGFWDRVKHAAIDDGSTIRDLIFKALYEYIFRHNGEPPKKESDKTESR